MGSYCISIYSKMTHIYHVCKLCMNKHCESMNPLTSSLTLCYLGNPRMRRMPLFLWMILRDHHIVIQDLGAESRQSPASPESSPSFVNAGHPDSILSVSGETRTCRKKTLYINEGFAKAPRTYLIRYRFYGNIKHTTVPKRMFS